MNPDTFLTESQLRKELKRAVAISTQRDVAAALGLSHQYLNDIVNSDKPISTRVAMAMGYEKEVRFRKLK